MVEELSMIIELMSRITVTGIMGLIWWLERKERQLLRDILLEDWKLQNDDERTGKRVAANELLSG